MTNPTSTLICCEAFYNTNPRQLTVHVPSDKHIGFESDSDTMQNPPTPKRRGRPSIYSSDEERKAKHREQALRHYYRKKALQEQQNSHSDDGSLESLAHPPEEIRVTINAKSKTLGDIDEDITFKRVNGRLRKSHWF